MLTRLSLVVVAILLMLSLAGNFLQYQTISEQSGTITGLRASEAQQATQVARMGQGVQAANREVLTLKDQQARLQQQLDHSGKQATPQSTTTVAQSDFQTTVRDIVGKVSQLRGLPLKQDVQASIITRDQLQSMLETKAFEDTPADRIKGTDRLLKALHLLKPDADLKRAMLDLLGDQVIGFYDPKDRKLYVISDSQQLTALDKVTIAHELTHALQDQSYNLQSQPFVQSDNMDASLAADALIEGDATLSMLQYSQKYLPAAELAKEAQEQAKQPSKLSQAPPFLAAELYFPYDEGLRFVSALSAAGGWKVVDQAFQRLPVSTEQVMHPDKYTANELPVEVKPLDPARLGSGWRLLDSNVLGEFDTLAILKIDLPQQTAQTAASGWGGNSYSVLEDGTGRLAVCIRWAWDTDEDATEFYDAFTQRQQKEYGADLKVDQSSSSMTAWSIPGSVMRFDRSGKETDLFIAPDQATVEAMANQFPGK